VIHDAGNETIGRRVVEYLAPDVARLEKKTFAVSSLITLWFLSSL
jgi:hypothetical protein